MKSAIVAAPCKVNLSLDIIGVRQDGYHMLRSVMQTVDLYDYLLISESNYRGVFIECDRAQLACDTTNTAYRAAELFFRSTGIRDYAVKIEIIKNIPMQAGLGGGSSDAAAALAGLNRMFCARLDLDALCAIGAKVGADVPFCLKGGTVLCEGVGELFTELPRLPACFIVIAKPEQGISTTSSFRRYDKSGGVDVHPDVMAQADAIRAGDLAGAASLMGNVLEPVCNVPDIARLKQIMLDNGALGAGMTGSGSAVIGIFEQKRVARRVHRKLMAAADSVFIARPVSFGAKVTDGNAD